MVLSARAAADTDGANHLAIFLQRNSAGENHDLAVVGSVDSKKLLAGLRMGSQVLGRNVECARGVRFFLGNIDTADPCSVHADVRHQVAASISDSDVHGLSDFRSLLFRRGYYASCICQTNHLLSL